MNRSEVSLAGTFCTIAICAFEVWAARAGYSQTTPRIVFQQAIGRLTRLSELIADLAVENDRQMLRSGGTR